MAKLILIDAHIEVNGVTLSDHCDQVELPDEADKVETSGFGQKFKEYGRGLRDADITATFIADYSAGSVDATLYPLMDSGDTFVVKVRPTSDPISPTNPEYRMTARLYSYNSLAGGIGEASKSPVTFSNAADGIEKVTA